MGAAVEAVPTTRIDDPTDPVRLAAAVSNLEGYDWILLTSANGVERFADAVARRGDDGEPASPPRIAVIGTATARAARARGLVPDLVPDVHRGEALADALIAGGDLTGRRVLLARAQHARPVLPERLRAAGARVDDVAAYATRTDESSRDRLREVVATGALDWITFTASSAVRGFVDLAGADTGGARVAAIGPVTADTVRKKGLGDPIVAERATAGSLVERIAVEVAV